MTNKISRNGLTLMVNFSVIALCLALSLNMFVTGLPQKIFYLVSYLSVASVLYGLVRRRVEFKENGFLYRPVCCADYLCPDSAVSGRFT
ncbi:Uncharacterised protein [Pantoea agglomerans]|uniref:Uncharacterized protein n=1 Tax=Enterobacter agglomerans TaxID=549 RepID=A0A379AC92_ENTAG|nr:Uncharacterised protein [Pantoea agglomerans]